MSRNYTKQVTTNRKVFIEVVVAAILIGISVSVLAAIIFEGLKDKQLTLAISAIVIISIGLVFLSGRISKSRNANLTIESFIIVNPKTNEFVNIPRYDFCEQLYRFLKGAFQENPALKKQWDKEPVGSGFEFDIESNTGTRKATASSKLIKEAAEYYVLDRLSTHLTDYFNKEHYSESVLKKYARTDVPDILLANRFMELFTNAMENRAAFSTEREHDSKGVVVAASGKNGAIYRRFDLILPATSVVSRGKSGEILIDTEYFELSIGIDFDEMGYVTPREFERYYLGVDSYEESSEYSVDIQIGVRFKLKALFRDAKWDYYEWLDSFLSTLESRASASAFLEEIQWSLAYTMIQCGQISKNLPNKNVNKDAH